MLSFVKLVHSFKRSQLKIFLTLFHTYFHTWNFVEKKNRKYLENTWKRKFDFLLATMLNFNSKFNSNTHPLNFPTPTSCNFTPPHSSTKPHNSPIPLTSRDYNAQLPPKKSPVFFLINASTPIPHL